MVFCVATSIDDVGRTAAGADADQNIARAHEIAELKTEDLIESNIVAQRGDHFDVVAKRVDTITPLIPRDGIFAEIASKVVGGSCASAIADDEYLLIFAISVKKDMDGLLKFQGINFLYFHDKRASIIVEYILHTGLLDDGRLFASVGKDRQRVSLECELVKAVIVAVCCGDLFCRIPVVRRIGHGKRVYDCREHDARYGAQIVHIVVASIGN